EDGGDGQCTGADLNGKDNDCNGIVDDGLCMVNVPAGEFNQGCDSAVQTCKSNGDDKPIHDVLLSEYDIDKFEVSNDQYRECVTKGTCTAPSNLSSYKRASYYDNAAYSGYPVIYVNWQQASDYCTWANKKLPTEAEWEKAAKGAKPSNNTHPWGSDSPSCTFVNYNQCGEAPDGIVGDTWPVDYVPEDPISHLKNLSGYGAANMSGNVLEWVSDWYGSTYYSSLPYDNPTGPESGTQKVVRGGNWYTNVPKKNQLTTYYRISPDPTIIDMGYGFRCAKKK
ncbi:MAG: SUMF1/EgtB/PvdO family nonheme iron enzyme, partial [Nanoarchaeota archaeon]